MYVMLVLYTDMGSMIYNALVRGAMIKKKKKNVSAMLDKCMHHMDSPSSLVFVAIHLVPHSLGAIILTYTLHSCLGNTLCFLLLPT